jgi:hypothetical protein
MAQIAKQGIMVGGGRIVGQVSVDSGDIRADGGPFRPQLVLPLSISMHSRPEGSMVAVTSIRGWLSADQHAFLSHAICGPETESLTEGFPARSLPQGSVDHRLELRFLLTYAEVERLEALRHKAGSDIFTLYLGLEASVAGLRTYNEVAPGGEAVESQWDLNLGLVSQVLPFWNTRIQPAVVQIEQSVWVRDVLPGLGYDRVRLVEMVFPPPLPDHKSAAAQFDKARKALDQRRYDDCIQDCRGVLNMWEQQFRATSTVRLADALAKERGWAEDDIRRGLLDTLWRTVGDIANAPHHPEGDIDSQTFNGKDARLVLLLTAALSEYMDLG